MKYRKMGPNGPDISEVGLGGEYLLDQSYEVIRDVFDCAIEGGVNLLDLYLPQPEVRSHVGKALKGRRDKMHIQGHIGVTCKDGQYARTRDLAECKTAFEDLLARLQTDTIDFGMIHYCDDFADYEEVVQNGLFDYAGQLKKAGVIGQIGMSTHNPKIALRAIEEGRLDMLMFSINAGWDLESASEDIDELRDFGAMHEDGTGPDPDRLKLYRTCAAKGIGITVMKPYGGGRLLSEQYTPFDKALTPVQCLHYALERPGVVSVLPGCADRAQVQAALAYVEATEAQKDYSFISTSKKFSMGGQCMYCNHCLPCAVNIDIGMVTKLYDLGRAAECLPETVREHYAALDVKADACIECGQCEPNCPFGVKIIDNMSAAAELFSK